MANMDPALKRLFIQCLDQVKENYRTAEGELDKPAAVGAALAVMGKEYPEERIWWDTLSPQSFGEVIAGEYTRRRRKQIRGAAEAEHDDVEESHSEYDPTPEELQAEYSVPIGGGDTSEKKLGYCSIEELDALEALFERMEAGNAKTKVYIRHVKQRARQRQMTLGLDDTATLFQIFAA